MILDKQHVKHPPVPPDSRRECRVTSSGRARLAVGAEHCLQALQQFLLGTGFAEIGRDAVLAAVLRIAPRGTGGEHDLRHIRRARIIPQTGRQRETVHFRHLCIEDDQLWDDAVDTEQRIGTGRQCRHLHAPVLEHPGQHEAVGGVVIDQQHAHAGQRRWRHDGIASLGIGRQRQLEQEGAARPGVLSTQRRPAIIITSRFEMVRPNPVPPKRRVVELSSWANASKIWASLSAAMPMPVSLTLAAHVARLCSRAHPDHDLPAFGELQCIACQIEQDLPDASRVADGERGQRRV